MAGANEILREGGVLSVSREEGAPRGRHVGEVPPELAPTPSDHAWSYGWHWGRDPAKAATWLPVSVSAPFTSQELLLRRPTTAAWSPRARPGRTYEMELHWRISDCTEVRSRQGEGGRERASCFPPIGRLGKRSGSINPATRSVERSVALQNVVMHRNKRQKKWSQNRVARRALDCTLASLVPPNHSCFRRLVGLSLSRFSAVFLQFAVAGENRPYQI